MGHEAFDYALLRRQSNFSFFSLCVRNSMSLENFYVEFMKLKVCILYLKREQTRKNNKNSKKVLSHEAFCIERMGESFLFFTMPCGVLVEILFIHHKQISFTFTRRAFHPPLPSHHHQHRRQPMRMT